MRPTEPAHVLVVGAPRSGTTLLAAMIGSHPDVAMLNEDLFGSFRLLMGTRVRATKLCIPNQIEMRARPWRFALGFAVMFVQDGLNVIRDSVGRPRQRVDLAARDGIEDFLDLPDPTVVGVLRDPHDVIASIEARGGRPAHVAARRWTRAIEVLDEIRRHPRYGQHLVLVDYDDLVSHPESVMRLLLPAIGCAYDPAVLAGFSETPQYRNDSIRGDRAGRRGEKRFEHDVFDDSPTLEAAYRGLLDASLRP